jgi:hypothetical protein
MSVLEPRIGAVYVYERDGYRYIILDAERVGDDKWFLDVVGIESHRVTKHFAYYPSGGRVRFEPLADGEEVLFFQAMLAPETLKEKP